MGQQNISKTNPATHFTMYKQLPNGTLIQDQTTQVIHFMKDYSFTSQEAYQHAFVNYSKKLAEKHEHILFLERTNTKVQNTFCSTFYKITLIYEFIEHTLQEQIEERVKDEKVFDEKEVWSVLCSCILGMNEMVRQEGRCHSAISPKDLRVTKEGVVKLLALEMIGLDINHDGNQDGTPKMLCMTILSTLLMQEISNDSKQYLEELIYSIDCSNQMKNLLYMMINEKTRLVELEESLFKLVHEETDSLGSYSHTPLLQEKVHRSKQIELSNQIKEEEERSESAASAHQHAANTTPTVISTQYHMISNNLTSSSALCEVLPLDGEDSSQKNLIPDIITMEEETPDQSDMIHCELESSQKGEDSKNNTLREKTNHVLNNATQQATLIDQLYQHQTIHQKNSNHKTHKHSNNSNYQELHHNYSHAHPDQNTLFTDPKLLNLIQLDLQDIKKRKSISNSRNILANSRQQYQNNANIYHQNNANAYHQSRVHDNEFTFDGVMPVNFNSSNSQKELVMNEEVEARVGEQQKVGRQVDTTNNLMERDKNLNNVKATTATKNAVGDKKDHKKEEDNIMLHDEISFHKNHAQTNTNLTKQLSKISEEQERPSQHNNHQEPSYTNSQSHTLRERTSHHQSNASSHHPSKTSSLHPSNTSSLHPSNTSSLQNTERINQNNFENNFNFIKAQQQYQNSHIQSNNQTVSMSSSGNTNMNMSSSNNMNNSLNNQNSMNHLNNSKQCKVRLAMAENSQGMNIDNTLNSNGNKNAFPNELKKDVLLQHQQYPHAENLHSHLIQKTHLQEKNTLNHSIHNNLAFNSNKNDKLLIQLAESTNSTKLKMQPIHDLHQNHSTKNHSKSNKNSYQLQHNLQAQTHELEFVSQTYLRGKYEGTKFNGMRHGKGIFHYNEGGKYVGHWKSNKMHGNGILYYPNNQIAYEGEWENDQLSGYGTLYNEEVFQLSQPFDYRDFDEVDQFWVKYEGHFINDNKEGQGKLYLVNGQIYQGKFQNDMVQGEGILFRKDGTRVKGSWHQNKLIRLF